MSRLKYFYENCMSWKGAHTQPYQEDKHTFSTSNGIVKINVIGLAIR